MTEPFNDETDERLRAILRSEADSVTPSADALERIRSRTQHRPFASWLGLSWLRPATAVAAAAAIVGSVLVGTPQIREQFMPGPVTSAESSQTPETEPDGDHTDGGGAEPPATHEEPRPGASVPEREPEPENPPPHEDPEQEPRISSNCSAPPTAPPGVRSGAEENRAEECQTPEDPDNPGPTPGGESPGESPPPNTSEPEPSPPPDVQP